ncbi:MAG: MFS transporter [Candidatus Bathyarchaeia archaeon]|nr:MFS transporter [Candidatus Bathyarchaeia archaeon]
MKLAKKLKEEFSFFKGNYLILIISWILIDFAGELPGTYYSDYVIQLGGSATILGLITLVSMLALASVQFPGGYLADKYGRRWLISTLTFGVALSYILYAAALSWHFILIGAAIQSLCLLYQPALNAMVADSLPPEKRGMGFSILNLIMSVATTPAPAVALLLVASHGSEMGMRIAYTIVTIFFLAAAIVRLKLKESMKTVEKLNFKEALHSYPKALEEGINVWKVVPHSTLFLFFSTLIVRFSFAMTGTLFLVYAFYILQIGGTPNPALYPNPADDPALQLARIEWGYVMIALFICMIILSFPTGKLIDKVGRKISLIVSSLLMIPATLLFVYGNYSTLFIVMPLFGFTQLLGFSAYQTLFADLVPQAQRGKVTGSMNFFTYIFMAIGGIAGGLLYDNASPQLPFLLMPILIVPSILLIVFYVREPRPEEREA